MGDTGSVAGRRCRAHLCPDDVSESAPEGVLCGWHWEILPAVHRTWLADSWGTPNWKAVLTECVRELRRLEAERTSPPW